ncbi:TetR/AcrR family transcriptional regulator [Vibrio ziniensis]|uniref:TetR/AcrR family transcriptional regulator n=1 Tax=Vibrio ziniensis TaxID=2711221 RepID=A0A6G7CQB6_9VIBR|nr:TetR/AcrR family transcriptional regulator [Vibrio ziniensis]QIH44337.1 TetR/AcrR family transcriptional regulator [Vibrio ziniensis]
MAKDTLNGRQKVIEAAATMLALQGLRGISIREVTKFANAPLGSTYHNFPGGKYQIVTEAIIWAGDQAAQQLQTCLEMDKVQGINLFLSHWRTRLTKSQFRAGCPIVAAAIEAPQEEGAESVKEAVSQVFAKWQMLIANHLESLGHSSITAKTLALGIIASVEGAVVLCRGHQNTLALDAVLECVTKLVSCNFEQNPV